MKTEIDIPYSYTIENIGTAKDPAYKAYIPAINGVVYDDTPDAVNEGVAEVIKDYIRDCKKSGRSIPPPERTMGRSGRLALRIDPVIHARLVGKASRCGKSLNRYIADTLAASL